MLCGKRISGLIFLSRNEIEEEKEIHGNKIQVKQNGQTISSKTGKF